MRLLRNAGLMIVFLASFHMVVWGAVTSGTWLRLVERGLLLTVPLDLRPTNYADQVAFWITMGSFAVPLIILGAYVAWAGSRDLPVPAFVGWGFGAYTLVATVPLGPTPFLLAPIPAGMIIVAARRRARAAGPAEPELVSA